MLLVVLGALLLVRAIRPQADPSILPPDNDNVAERPETRTLDRRDLPGETPPVPPEFDLSFDVPRTVGGDNELIIHISERHGYYVEQFRLEIKKKHIDYRLELYYERYLPAGDVLVIHEHVVPAELRHFGGGLGTGEDWEGIVTRHGRYRAENPDPLPDIVASP